MPDAAWPGKMSPVQIDCAQTLPSQDDHYWMTQAISLARSMQGHVWPNPPVGCVIVRNDIIVGRGKTQPGGRPHAERVALDDAGDAAQDATMYVTLEPCCHWGKTPPCAEAIISAGIAKVFASLQDPDPRVNGGGFLKLKGEGVIVDIGLGAIEAQSIMAGFFHRIATGQPLLTIAESHRAIGAGLSGFDGRLVSNSEGIWLFTSNGVGQRVSGAVQTNSAATKLLDDLGSKGLTSLVIHADDSAAPSFRKMSQTDPERVSPAY